MRKPRLARKILEHQIAAGIRARASLQVMAEPAVAQRIPSALPYLVQIRLPQPPTRHLHTPRLPLLEQLSLNPLPVRRLRPILRARTLPRRKYRTGQLRLVPAIRQRPTQARRARPTQGTRNRARAHRQNRRNLTARKLLLVEKPQNLSCGSHAGPLHGRNPPMICFLPDHKGSTRRRASTPPERRATQ